jgi:hypothetical protein
MLNKGVKWRCALWKMSDGKPVIEFCRETGASYQTIWKHINDKGLSVDDACKKALERKGRKDNTKLFIGNTPLIEYCRKKGIKYHSVYNKMLRGFSIENAISFVVNRKKATI